MLDGAAARQVPNRRGTGWTILSRLPDFQAAVEDGFNERDGKLSMNLEEERARFGNQYGKLQEALVCQGLRPKTISAYSRGVRRVAGYFKRCPDNLTADELKSYFAALVESHSWSTVKLDRNGI